MTKKEKKQVRHLVFEIVYVSFLLVFLTWFWYGPRKAMLQKEVDTGYQIAGLDAVQVTTEMKEKTIAITNESAKGNLLLRFEEEKGSNRANEIYYQVITGEGETEVRNLSQDGAIYLFNLEEKGDTSLRVRLWTEDEDPILGTLTVASSLSNSRV